LNSKYIIATSLEPFNGHQRGKQSVKLLYLSYTAYLAKYLKSFNINFHNV